MDDLYDDESGTSIRTYKIKSKYMNSPSFYGAYNEQDAKEVASSDTNSQIRLSIEECTFEELPTGVVLLNAKLNREDARKLSLMQDKLTPDPNYEDEF